VFNVTLNNISVILWQSVNIYVPYYASKPGPVHNTTATDKPVYVHFPYSL